MHCGLIGEHLTHSYSCDIHAMLADYEYKLIELRPDELDGFMTAKKFDAVNVTIPYKQAVIPYLDDISDSAKRIGAVNTIVNKSGKLYGYNTDYAGLLALAKRIGIDAKGKKLLILGTGGTSKTAFAAAQDMGAADIIKISRSSRDGAASYTEALDRHSDAQIIFNTTPAGMFPNTDGQALELDNFEKLEAVLDVVYNPLRTDFVLSAQERHIASECGLYMLCAQAVYASALFLGKDARDDDIERTFKAIYEAKRNIVLIGMPSSGKSSVGKLLADRLGKTFRDTDGIILKKIGMPITDYFAKYGEAAFRNVEREVIASVSKESGLVIATGGGAILDKNNVRALKHNGTLVFLDRSPDKLVCTSDRPLSCDRESLMRRYGERYNKYKAAADIIIDGNGSVSETVRLAITEIGK